MDQLEWGDHLVRQAQPGDYENPPGFYVYLLKNNIPVPDDFETSRKRGLREEARQTRERSDQERAELRLAYEKYRSEEIDRYIEREFGPESFESLMAEKEQDFLSRSPNNAKFSPELRRLMVTGAARAKIQERAAFTTFEAFCEERQSASLPDKEPFSVSTGNDRQGSDQQFVV